MAALSQAQQQRALQRLSQINHVLLVLSGKGGVGKSSVSVQLALSLLAQHPSAKIGILDIDLTGPSLPRMLGLQGSDIHQSSAGWVPVHLESGEAVLKCMSIGFMLKNDSESVVWRGPKKTAMIRQFLGDVRWGELDWLIIDTPPGTSDEHISLLEQLRPLVDPSSFFLESPSSNFRLPSLHSILVTTPQAVSLSDVAKELSFARKTQLPVLGLIENMSGYICPHCGDVTPIFGQGGGEAFCKQEEEKKASGEQTGSDGCRFLGRIPVDAEFTKLMDTAAHEHADAAAESNHGITNGESPVAIRKATLLERYRQTPTYPIFQEVCQRIIKAIEGKDTSDELQQAMHKSSLKSSN